MTVSVIIATCNRLESLRQTLTDLAAQSRRPDEIIVIDQSREESGAPIDQRASLVPESNVKYILQSIQNAEVARNRGIRESRGDLLIFIDDDMRLPIGFVDAHLENYSREDHLDAIAGQVLKQNQKPATTIPSISKWGPDGWMLLPLNLSERCDAINWPSCNASIRREVAIAAGGFDEQFKRTWFDDSDFSWRLKCIGARVVFDPTASAIHLKVASGGKRPGVVDALVLADAEHWATVLYFWRKNFGLWAVRHHFWIYLKRMFYRKCFFLHPIAFLKAIREFISGYKIATKRLAEGPIYPWPPKALAR